MAIARTPTLLSLDRYASIIGINPAHFNGAQNSNVMPVTATCSNVVYQYDWQAFDRVGREQIAEKIATAEAEVAEAIGFWPAPTWIEQEVQQYPRPHRRDWLQTGMRDVRGYRKAVKARWAKIIAPGQRAVTDITAASLQGAAGSLLSYDDLDGDTYAESASIQVDTDVDLCEIKFYYQDTLGLPEWEIRPWRYVYKDPAGFYVFVFWAWQFIKPSVLDALTTQANPEPVDFIDTDNLVTAVEVKRVYNDTTDQSAKLYWEPDVEVDATVYCPACAGSGCEVCGLSTQDGCAHVADAEDGLLVPTPGTYDDDDARWEEVAMSVNRDPDFVKLWYYTGDMRGRSLETIPAYDLGTAEQRPNSFCDPLSDFWAEIIAWIATARLRRRICGCDNVNELVDELQQDITRIETDGNRWTMIEDDLRNPFGTKVGEVRAWRRIERIARRKVEGAVLP